MENPRAYAQRSAEQLEAADVTEDAERRDYLVHAAQVNALLAIYGAIEGGGAVAEILETNTLNVDTRGDR